MRNVRLLVGMSLALACNDDAASGACGEVPELVMKFAPGALVNAGYPWQRGEQVFLPLRHDEDTISLYSAERCGGGVPQQLVGPELDLAWANVTPTAAGELLLGHRKSTGEILLLDRLDVPGRDVPRPILTLGDRIRATGSTTLLGGGLLISEEDPPESGDLRPLTGPLRSTSTLYFYPGPAGLAAPPVMLAEDIVEHYRDHANDRLYALNAVGDLLAIDSFGDHEVLQAGVHAMSFSPDGTQVAWQARGDGPSEPVYLRTLATGVDAAIGVNVATAPSPGANRAGTWLWSDDALALIGPEDTILRAHARQDGALLSPPPPHLEVAGYWRYNPGRDLFILRTVDAFMEVGLAWDPVAGLVVEWYRGDVTDKLSGDFHRTDEGLYYSVWNKRDPETSRLWLSRLDGRPAELLLANFAGNTSIVLDDGRIVMSLGAVPPGGERLVVYDPADRSTERLATDFGLWLLGRDFDEILYIRVDGPDAGLWARPL